MTCTIYLKVCFQNTDTTQHKSSGTEFHSMGPKCLNADLLLFRHVLVTNGSLDELSDLALEYYAITS